jgi:putative tryptophan/tyrosine transport system substrate-binding protein
MRRREFIAVTAGAAAWPLAARAQQPALPLVGFLRSANPEARLVAAFRQGLSQNGYVEGQNVAIEFRSADGQYDRLPELAADLVRRKVAVIASFGGLDSVLAAKAATTSIPIVFVIGGDPVKLGVVASLNRPGGNLTGVSLLTYQLDAKRLELMHELVPTATPIAMLVNPKNSQTESGLIGLQAAAQAIGQQIMVLNASTVGEVDGAFATLVQQRAGALIVSSDPFFQSVPDHLVALASRHAVPTIYPWREFADAGGLMVYQTSIGDAYRQAGVYVGRVLKGEKPADLPVQQSVKVELIVNLKTAKAFGLSVPLSLLGRADEVIE